MNIFSNNIHVSLILIVVVYRERSFVDYIQDLRLRVIRIAIAIGAATVFCMTFGIGSFNIEEI